jgi:hypothetical protein
MENLVYIIPVVISVMLGFMVWILKYISEPTNKINFKVMDNKSEILFNGGKFFFIFLIAFFGYYFLNQISFFIFKDLISFKINKFLAPTFFIFLTAIYILFKGIKIEKINSEKKRITEKAKIFFVLGLVVFVNFGIIIINLFLGVVKLNVSLVIFSLSFICMILFSLLAIFSAKVYSNPPEKYVIIMKGAKKKYKEVYILDDKDNKLTVRNNDDKISFISKDEIKEISLCEKGKK